MKSALVPRHLKKEEELDNQDEYEGAELVFKQSFT